MFFNSFFAFGSATGVSVRCFNKYENNNNYLKTKLQSKYGDRHVYSVTLFLNYY